MTDNEKYEEIQEEYLENRDNKSLTELYYLCVKLAKKYLSKYCRKKGISLNIEEKSHDAAVFVIEQYLKKPEFKVNRISAYIYFGVIKNLYKDKHIEMSEVSYEEMVEKDRNFNEKIYL
jgi:uncharacterized protein (UPF0128 family)